MQPVTEQPRRARRSGVGRGMFLARSWHEHGRALPTVDLVRDAVRERVLDTRCQRVPQEPSSAADPSPFPVWRVGRRPPRRGSGHLASRATTGRGWGGAQAAVRGRVATFHMSRRRRAVPEEKPASAPPVAGHTPPRGATDRTGRGCDPTAAPVRVRSGGRTRAMSRHPSWLPGVPLSRVLQASVLWRRFRSRSSPRRGGAVSLCRRTRSSERRGRRYRAAPFNCEPCHAPLS